jgi:putative transposase
MLKTKVKAKRPDKIVENHTVLNGTEALPYALQKRLEALQYLKSFEGKVEYRKKQTEVAEQLGISLRSLYRYINRYRDEGLEGITRRERSDQGQKISEEWREFIEKSYREGNRGMRSSSAAQIANLVESTAKERGEKAYPSRATVYRVLEVEKKKKEKKQNSRSIGWQGEKLEITTKEGMELSIKYSNQVWQCDHNYADIMLVDSEGGILGRPMITTVVDSFSRCIVGIHLGLNGASAAVTCLALRHSIMPKEYGSSYGLSNDWSTYGVPEYLYTDAGADFTSKHIDQIAASLGITLCLRRKPSDGGIVERPFGTINTELLSTLPGYTTARLKGHRTKVEAEACLTLQDLERLLVRYIVDNYNQRPDSRIGKQSRIGRWEEGRIVQPPLISERELDILLMRKDRRRVYQGGYIKFSNLLYKGEYLAGYAGESVVLRYNPLDITTLLVYIQKGGQDVFLTRAYAHSLEAERLTLADAKAINKKLRGAAKEITNRSVLEERYDRNRFVEDLLREKASPVSRIQSPLAPNIEEDEDELEQEFDPATLPKIQVYDYEQLCQEHGYQFK